MALDFVQQVDTLESFAKTFVFCPRQWDQFAPPAPLKWRCLKFSRVNLNKVPPQSGVYAFVLRKRSSFFPPHGYIMYVGMTGSDGGGTLRNRFSAYLSERKVLKRPKIHYMLNKWPGHIYFYYAEIDQQHDIPAIEQQLCDAIIPPCNINDFSAEIRRVVRAFMR